MNDLIPQDPPAFLAAILCVLPVLSFYAFWRIRRAESIHWLKWNNVSALPLSPLEVLTLVLLVACGMLNPALYVLLPVIASGCAVFFAGKHGISLRTQWGIDPARFPRFFRYSFNTYFAILLPIALITGISSLLCQQLGYTDLVQPAIKVFQESHDPKQIVGFILLASVFAPLWEEMVFRGLLYPWLKSLISRDAALLASAVIFALIHWHVPSFIPLVSLGLALALSYEYTGSLFSSIALHGIFNFATCLNLLLMRQT